ncbi:hypothetical protein [Streptomyces sp. NPDC048489]|uniref:hypothetical protein n=1 Tax=Streptomyces sp. NPDC048489 TaxID=3154504 RepID=UPI003428A36D
MWQFSLDQARWRFDRIRSAAIAVVAVCGLVHYTLGAPSPWVGWVILAAWTVADVEIPYRALRYNRWERKEANLWWEERSHTRSAADPDNHGYVIDPGPPRDINGNQHVAPTMPITQIYLGLTFLAAALYGTRGVLASLESNSRLEPSDAPALVSSAVGIPIITVVIFAAPQVIRAWGEKSRSKNQGEAAVILAQAQLRRADAEFRRAELGIAPLPPSDNNGIRPDGLPPTVD